MKGWILSIVGLIFIGVILDVVLSDGKTASFIKHIFSLFLLFVIISPISKLSINKNWFSSNQVVSDSDFIYEINIQKVEAITNKIKEELKNIDVYDAQVVVYADVFSGELKVNSVYVDISSSKFSISSDITKAIKQVVIKIVNINENEVFVYGR